MAISSTVFCYSVITDRKGIAEDIFITSSFISTQNVQKRCRHTCYDFALGRNELTGSIPSEFGMMTGLQQFVCGKWYIQNLKCILLA